MKTLRFYQIDVFCDKPLTGNPLALFPEGDGLDAKEMQAIAREMGLSETTFVFPSDVATRRVRFFTPAAEIPLAGHPTIGTWWGLAELGRLDLPHDGGAQVTQETGAGVLPVEIGMAGGKPTAVIMTQAHPEFGVRVTDSGNLAAALGGGGSLIPDHPAPQVVSTGLPQMMIPVRSLTELSQLPTGGKGGELAALLRSYGTDCAMCYTVETESSESTVHCRMFAPGLGVPEDPATGSAAGALGCYLVQNDVIHPEGTTATVIVEQGIEIGRPSRIEVKIAVGSDGSITKVRVGGRAVTVIEGEVRL
jgi:trans-2,3-dihydro-3-hydroxyanthranilate isomerase